MARASRLSCVVLLAIAGNAGAEFEPPSLVYDHVLLQTSLATVHFTSNPEHNDQQQLLDVEIHDTRRWFAGAAWFKNSFDQPSWYFYAGREIPLARLSALEVRAKLTAGLLRGYDGDKRDNIPLNHLGIAPAVLPTLGLRWKRLEADAMVFGSAGMMATLGLRF